MLKKIIIPFLIFLSSVSNSDLFSQDPTTKGKDFWFTFMPNSHNASTADLRIIVMAYEETNVSLEYTNKLGITKKESFYVDNGDLTYVYKVKETVIKGFVTEFNGELNDSQVPEISNLSYHLTSDKDIELLIINSSQTSSDATLVLPTHGIGNKYFVQSYYTIDATGWGSQFALIAPEDSTEIVVIPSDMISENIKSLYKVELQKGEVYFAKGDQFNDNASDLTGTQIISNKPIYMYSGHKRARVPQNSIVSQDHLFTNVLPVGFTGLEYLSFPLGKGVIDKSVFANDSIRVIAYEDDTEIYFGEKSIGKINTSNYISFPLEKSHLIRANKPIATYEIKQSSGQSSGGNQIGISDPFLITIPSFEQYSSEYTFYNFKMKKSDSISPVFNNHFIGVAISEEGLKTLKLDGTLIDENLVEDNFKESVKEGFVYFNMSVSPGRHTITSDEKFCSIIYGYGAADSYGYTANGFKLVKIDPSPPSIEENLKCYSLEGVIFDSEEFDTGIASANVNDSKNITLTTIIDGAYSHTVNYSASLTNLYEDGYYYLQTIDTNGQKYFFEKVNIPGFTVKIEDSEPEINMIKYDNYLPLDSSICYSYTIENYGNYDQENLNLYLDNIDNFEIIENIDFLASKDKYTFEICFDSKLEPGVHKSNLFIGNDCLQRKIAEFTVESQEDTLAPLSSIETDKCLKNVEIKLEDKSFYDLGIKEGRVIVSLNCNIEEVNDLMPNELEYSIEIINQYEDAIYHIEVEDERSNITTILDTIQGYTLNYGDLGSYSTTVNFEGTSIGNNICDTLKIFNYGLLPISFDYSYLNSNIDFSVPSTQYPIVINPNEYFDLILCFRPSNSDRNILKDEMRFQFNCLETIINLEGFGTEISAESQAKCEVDLLVTQDQIPDAFFIQNIYPNPLNSIANLVIGNPERQEIIISLYDNFGNKVTDLIDGRYNAGIYKLNIRFYDIASGTYFYVIKTNQEIISKRLIIEK